MSSDLYMFAGPPGTEVVLQLDSGAIVTGLACSAKGRADAFRLVLPTGTPRQGGVLTQTYEGASKVVRGITIPVEDGEAAFQFDDFGILTAAAPPEPVPGPEPEPDPKPPMTDPEEIVKWVYSSGAYGEFDLSTHEGCGQYTEACVTCLHLYVSEAYGHIAKAAGQNQYNGHAVDALYRLAGEGSGVYDIVHDSVAPGATPQYIWKDSGDPALWYYPAAARSDVSQRARLAKTATAR